MQHIERCWVLFFTSIKKFCIFQRKRPSIFDAKSHGDLYRHCSAILGGKSLSMENRRVSEEKGVFKAKNSRGEDFRRKYTVYNEIIQLLKGTDMDKFKSKVKNGAIKVKNHVVRHKAAYAFGGLAVTAVVLQKQQAKAFEGFLVEKGIDPIEFYFPVAITEVTI